MIGIEIDKAQMSRLTAAVIASGKKMSKEIAGTLNAVSKKTKLNIGKTIRETVNLKKDMVEKPLSIRASATAGSLVAIVSLKKTDRYGLQHFGAKQNKSGVSYRIAKSGGRNRVNSAFMGPKPGQLAPKLYGGVWKRIGDARKMAKGRRQGKIAQPILKLYGVSPWGVYVKNDMTAVEVEAVSKELFKQMERRINLNVLRASGLVKT